MDGEPAVEHVATEAPAWQTKVRWIVLHQLLNPFVISITSAVLGPSIKKRHAWRQHRAAE